MARSRLLQKAFPEVQFTPGVRPPEPSHLNREQRQLLQAITANDQLWDSRNGNAYLAFMRVGLPHDRQAIQRLVKSLPDAKGGAATLPGRRRRLWRRNSVEPRE